MESIEKKIEYQFKNRNLLEQALTHKSFLRKDVFDLEKKEFKKKVSKLVKKKELKPDYLKNIQHNEKLEFLGDAVLNLSIAHLLMKNFPQLNEGDLSKLRAAFVNEKSLAAISSRLGLNLKLKVGQESEKIKLNQKSRLKASVLEALVGAYFLDSDYQRVDAFITKMFKNQIKKKSIKAYLKMDYKSDLQEKLQKQYKTVPTYILDKEQGPDHRKTFYVKVYLKDQMIGSGKGQSKKEAEQEAAKKVLMKF